MDFISPDTHIGTRLAELIQLLTPDAHGTRNIYCYWGTRHSSGWIPYIIHLNSWVSFSSYKLQIKLRYSLVSLRLELQLQGQWGRMRASSQRTHIEGHKKQMMVSVFRWEWDAFGTCVAASVSWGVHFHQVILTCIMTRGLIILVNQVWWSNL